jgi:SAM-dependent methyltransferase
MFLTLLKVAIAGVLRASMAGQRRGQRLTRHSMYRRLQAAVPAPASGAAALSISHSIRLCQALGLPAESLTEANFPDFDLLELPFPDNHFDYVVSEAVLEHVEGDPRQAIHESFRVLKTGGIAVHTSCFVSPVHYGPRDLWRFSPEGLALLAAPFGEILEQGGWGNVFACAWLWLDLSEERVPAAHWHPVHRLANWNSEPWPVVTWVVARKQG